MSSGRSRPAIFLRILSPLSSPKAAVGGGPRNDRHKKNLQNRGKMFFRLRSLIDFKSPAAVAAAAPINRVNIENGEDAIPIKMIRSRTGGNIEEQRAEGKRGNMAVVGGGTPKNWSRDPIHPIRPKASSKHNGTASDQGCPRPFQMGNLFEIFLSFSSFLSKQ